MTRGPAHWMETEKRPRLLMRSFWCCGPRLLRICNNSRIDLPPFADTRYLIPAVWTNNHIHKMYSQRFGRITDLIDGLNARSRLKPPNGWGLARIHIIKKPGLVNQGSDVYYRAKIWITNCPTLTN
jgi:hypothetical protein